MLRHAPWVAALLLFASAPVTASTLPMDFVLSEMGEMWKPLGKTGLTLQWEVQNYENGQAVGPAEPGKLYLKGGRYRAESGSGDDQLIRVYNNAAGAQIEDGRFAQLRPEVQASLPEGLFLRFSRSAIPLLEHYGIDGNLASYGRMATGNPEMPFHTVLRYGAKEGPEDLSVPQIWIQPHNWHIHRVIAKEGDKLLQVDYLGHGKVSEEYPWLPNEIIFSKDGKILWTARLIEPLGELPTESSFDIKALEAQAK